MEKAQHLFMHIWNTELTVGGFCCCWVVCAGEPARACLLGGCLFSWPLVWPLVSLWRGLLLAAVWGALRPLARGSEEPAVALPSPPACWVASLLRSLSAVSLASSPLVTTTERVQHKRKCLPVTEGWFCGR